MAPAPAIGCNFQTRAPLSSSGASDVRDWQRRNLLKSGAIFVWSWWDENEEKVASIIVQTKADREGPHRYNNNFGTRRQGLLRST